MLFSINEANRQKWLAKVLGALPSGSRVLDAGAGELQNKKHCSHLQYVSQDFCQYVGAGRHANEGLHRSKKWDTSGIDIVCDIVEIPEPDASFDAILCSEVLEHVPEPTQALDEFARLLKPGGVLILTAPFSSNVHMAPYHYCSGFSRYWYEHHLASRGLAIRTLEANGDWYSLLTQELLRLGGVERRKGAWTWPLAYGYAALGLLYFASRFSASTEDLACFGWHCVAEKQTKPAEVAVRGVA